MTESNTEVTAEKKNRIAKSKKYVWIYPEQWAQILSNPGNEVPKNSANEVLGAIDNANVEIDAEAGVYIVELAQHSKPKPPKKVASRWTSKSERPLGKRAKSEEAVATETAAPESTVPASDNTEPAVTEHTGSRRSRKQ